MRSSDDLAKLPQEIFKKNKIVRSESFRRPAIVQMNGIKSANHVSNEQVGINQHTLMPILIDQLFPHPLESSYRSNLDRFQFSGSAINRESFVCPRSAKIKRPPAYTFGIVTKCHQPKLVIIAHLNLFEHYICADHWKKLMKMIHCRGNCFLHSDFLGMQCLGNLFCFCYRSHAGISLKIRRKSMLLNRRSHQISHGFEFRYRPMSLKKRIVSRTSLILLFSSP